MIRYILDTDVLSECIAIRGDVLQKVRPLQAQGLAITIISIEEQFAGWYTALRRAKTRNDVVLKYANMTTSMRFMTRLNILSFDLPALLRFELLLKQKLNVRKPDLRIAAITLEQGATLVTRNLKDFRRVPGLTTLTV